MSEPLMTIVAGAPLDRTALDAMSIHLRNGCVFQPVFRTSETSGPTGKVVIAAELVAVQLVKPAEIPVVVSPAPLSPEEVVQLKECFEPVRRGKVRQVINDAAVMAANRTRTR